MAADVDHMIRIIVGVAHEQSKDYLKCEAALLGTDILISQ
jgi:hypothetical protein